MKRLMMVATTAIGVTVAVSGCSTFEPQGPAATASLAAAPKSQVWSSVAAVALKNGVLVRADVRNLPSGSEFGFHVHEKGQCTPPDFMSAGGHFNPGGQPHAHHGKAARHAGDLRNLNANGEGDAVYVFETSLLTVRPGPNSVIGKAIVIHANPDDYTSQPAGNSGPRIACGLIRAVD
jgi:Cu-Zn family superoxide dismutase